jgi:hypothetical protein
MTKQQYIMEQITKIFLSRNMTPLKGLFEVWVSDLEKYEDRKLVNSFERYRKYGDNFPSLPAIIALVENRVDSDTASIDAWSSVRKAMKLSSSKTLTPAEKEVLNRVSTGLTACMEASTFDLSQIERDFKKMYKAGYEGISREISIEPSGAVQIASKPETKSIENGGLFESK